MTEFLKFGPNWLKNKVEGTSDTISRPIIAQHRYGPEEMLSLCEQNLKKPEILHFYPKLYINHFQLPLAFKPEEEKPIVIRPRTFLNTHCKNGNWRKPEIYDEKKSAGEKSVRIKSWRDKDDVEPEKAKPKPDYPQKLVEKVQLERDCTQLNAVTKKSNGFENSIHHVPQQQTEQHLREKAHDWDIFAKLPNTLEKLPQNIIVNQVPPKIEINDPFSLQQPQQQKITWFYMDPMGMIQGPFSEEEMTNWYDAKFFNESLMVRRSTDNNFVTLGYLTKLFGSAHPFVIASSGIAIPPVQSFFPLQPAINQQPAPVHQWKVSSPEEPMFYAQNQRQFPNNGNNFQSGYNQQSLYSHVPSSCPQQQYTNQQVTQNMMKNNPSVTFEMNPIQKLLQELQIQQKMQHAQNVAPSVHYLNENFSDPQSRFASTEKINELQIFECNEMLFQQRQQQLKQQQQYRAPIERQEHAWNNHGEMQFQRVEYQRKKKIHKDPIVEEKKAEEGLPKTEAKPKIPEKKIIIMEERSLAPATKAPWIDRTVQENIAPHVNLANIQKTEEEKRQMIFLLEKERRLRSRLNECDKSSATWKEVVENKKSSAAEMNVKESTKENIQKRCNGKGEMAEAVLPKNKSPEAKNTSKRAPNKTAEFKQWCIDTLHRMHAQVDIPAFVSFLISLESPFEIEEYIKMYLGKSSESLEFINMYLEKRIQYRNKKKTQEDDLCAPARAINPTSAQADPEKRNNARKKKGKSVKMDARELGFRATASSTRIVGELDKDY